METRDEMTGGRDFQQKEEKHPEEYREDLNPTRLQGQNIGPEASEEEREMMSAHDIKELRQRLSGFDRDDLERIPIVPPGRLLTQGATYLRLDDGKRDEFVATAEMKAPQDGYLVPKGGVDYELWNQLRESAPAR